MLIVFEGIDGSGKGAQIRMLARFFRQHRVRYKLHAYPTKKAKDAFLHLSGKKTVPARKLAEIFASDIVAEKGKLEGEMRQGFVVVCDRYLHSTLAYQGVGAGYSELKGKLGRMGAIVPDLAVLLDVDPALSFKRKRGQKKPDRHERDLPFLSKVRRNYLRMARGHFLAYKYTLIEAGKPADEVFSEVVMQVEPFVTGMGRRR
ncbi:MAG: dTMP kinase [Candidatus Micrarchaeia archaeon]